MLIFVPLNHSNCLSIHLYDAFLCQDTSRACNSLCISPSCVQVCAQAGSDRTTADTLVKQLKAEQDDM